jgi:hypothetical protein
LRSCLNTSVQDVLFSPQKLPSLPVDKCFRKRTENYECGLHCFLPQVLTDTQNILITLDKVCELQVFSVKYTDNPNIYLVPGVQRSEWEVDRSSDVVKNT